MVLEEQQQFVGFLEFWNFQSTFFENATPTGVRVSNNNNNNNNNNKYYGPVLALAAQHGGAGWLL
jgi:hypothetical protein